MLKRTILAATLAAALPAAFAQSSNPGAGTPGSALGSSGSTLGAPSSTVPATGAFSRPGDTTLPGSATTPGLSTLPGVRDENSSTGATTPPSSTRLPAPSGSQITPGVLGPAPSSSGVIGGPRVPCEPGSALNGC